MQRMTLQASLLLLVLASALGGCGDSNPGHPERRGTLTVRAHLPEDLPTSGEVPVSHMMATLDGDTTIVVELLRISSWSREVELSAGVYEIRVDAYNADTITWSGFSMAEVIAARVTTIDVQLRWLVPTDLSLEHSLLPGSPSVDLQWRFGGTAPNGFLVIRDGDGTTQTFGVDSTAFRDTTVRRDISYEYRVAVADTTGLPGPWSAGTAVTLPVVPMPPDDGGTLFVPNPEAALRQSSIDGSLRDSWLAVQQGEGPLLIRVDGSDSVRVGPGKVLSWSPGAEWIAVQDGRSAYVYHVESGQSHALFADGSFSGWSPDGTRVLIDRRPERGVWVRSIRSGDEHLAATGSPVAWSPVSELIGFEVSAEHVEDLPTIFVTSAGSEPTLLARGRAFGFSPDGSWMAYVSGSRRDWEYRAVRIDGTDDRRLGGSVDDTFLYWGPDSRRVVIATSHPTLAIVSVEQGSPLVLTEGAPHSVAWSPTGELIAFFTQQRMHDDAVYLHVIGPEGTDETRLAELVALEDDRRAHSWSPDGRYLAAALREDSASGAAIYVIDTETGAHARLTDGIDVLWSPAP